uniref:Intraflagellar transport protein 140 putative n=1 Tax=Albugo laibachii Nc14 TaxID=890382 RepID=F0W382_9STRA|nr:intraflagellar transport protein 140 putative [Albugo laibachii Nc14]|eukprot:CCA15523.1 intraflagellar transport protein 140 putative [Albugo laibachii Nc14]
MCQNASVGIVSLWLYKSGLTREVNSPHTTRVNLIKWSPSGNRLFTSDENGIFAVWKVDTRSQITLATRYTRQGKFTHCVFAMSAAQREKEQKSELFSQHVCPPFFFGGELGSVHHADDLGHISDLQVFNHAIDAMVFNEKSNSLIVITRGSQLIVFQIQSSDRSVKITHRVKLSLAGDGSLREVKWAGTVLLAIASGESLIRFWNVQTEQSSFLSLPKTESILSHQVNTIDFNPKRRILAAGTAQGFVLLWRCTTMKVIATESSKSGGDLTYRWDLLFTIDQASSVTKVCWSPIFPILYANTEKEVLLLHEGTMQHVFNHNIAIIQNRPASFVIEKFQDGTISQSTVDTGFKSIKGISHDGLSVVVWNGSHTEVYDIREGLVKRLYSFECSSNSMILRGDSIYRTSGNHVEICNLQGVVKNTISFTEAEGKPQLLSVKNKFLAVGTDHCFIRVFDLSRREPKAIGSMGNFSIAVNGELASRAKSGKITSDSICSFGICMISVNADGTRVCIIAERLEGSMHFRAPASKLIVFQTELNIFQEYDFGRNRMLISSYFDPQEPRLIACETRKVRHERDTALENSTEPILKNDSISRRDEASQSGTSVVAENEITVLFASNKHGLLLHDSFELDQKYSALLGIHVPRIFLVAQVDAAKTSLISSEKNEHDNSSTVSYLRTKTMRDYVGSDKMDDSSRQAMIDFCYYMTIGNMDEAYRSVKLIENASVWENMAHMCVKTKQLDVAQVCLGNMGHARGAIAVQDARQEPESEAAIAMVAIQLGLRDDAARLYRECGRYDLLNKLYRASGIWSKAIALAEKKDRSHLKNTHYHLGRHFEDLGAVDEAIQAYEDAGTHHKDVPRMLLRMGKMDLLKNYIESCNDNDALIWWAHFEESQGHFDLARDAYKRAKDYLSVVRVLCIENEFQQAVQIVKKSGNRAAAYHLARQFEAINDIGSAIHFFAFGRCYNHAIRLAKSHEMDSELMAFAVMSKPREILECAKYFEKKGEYKKAVQLYHKGGNGSQALELCFRAQLFDELHYLTKELSTKQISPALLKKTIDFFQSNGQYEKAVQLSLVAGRILEALNLCINHDVKVTEEMAEEMTPVKGEENAVEKKQRNDILLKLAKCCKTQGSYHLATKKYTQAGNKLKAMKCLLKSGDVEKVVFFANVSRNPEIYVLAGNYLQTLDWHGDADLLKTIANFYIKAKALEQLSSLYVSCAQTDIEDYQNYEKAVKSLQEGLKVISKLSGAGNAALRERVTRGLQRRVGLIDRFLSIRQQISAKNSASADTIPLLEALLEEADLSVTIQIGDAYGLLVSLYFDEQDFEKCTDLFSTMKNDKQLDVKRYIDSKILLALKEKHSRSIDDNVGQYIGSKQNELAGRDLERREDHENTSWDMKDEVGDELSEEIDEDT